MTQVDTFLSWIYQVIQGFATAWSWLNSEVIKVGDVSFSPLLLLTFGGLTAFVAVAIIKWAVS